MQALCPRNYDHSEAAIASLYGYYTTFMEFQVFIFPPEPSDNIANGIQSMTVQESSSPSPPPMIHTIT